MNDRAERMTSPARPQGVPAVRRGWEPASGGAGAGPSQSDVTSSAPLEPADSLARVSACVEHRGHATAAMPHARAALVSLLRKCTPSARSRNRREEAAWVASAAHRARTYRAQCPMPHQGWRSWFQPCTLRIQRTALLPQAAAGPRTKKSSAAFMQNQSPAKTARRRQLVDTGVAPLSAEHIGRWLAWGPALRPSPPDARHDPYSRLLH